MAWFLEVETSPHTPQGVQRRGAESHCALPPLAFLSPSTKGAAFFPAFLAFILCTVIVRAPPGQAEGMGALEHLQ